MLQVLKQECEACSALGMTLWHCVRQAILVCVDTQRDQLLSPESVSTLTRSAIAVRPCHRVVDMPHFLGSFRVATQQNFNLA